MTPLEEARKSAEEMRMRLAIHINSRKARHLLADVLVNNPVATIIFNHLDGTFSSGNPEWVKMMGWRDADIEVMPIEELIHPDDIPATIEAMELSAQNGEPEYFANRWRRKDGEYIWVIWHPSKTGEDQDLGAAFCAELSVVPPDMAAGFVPHNKVKKEQISIL